VGVWKKLFLLCVDKHAPVRNKRGRPCKSPWVIPQLKKRLHERDILKLKATRSGDADDWRNFKKLRNTVNSEIKRAKECHYKHALNEYHVTPGELLTSLCLGIHTIDCFHDPIMQHVLGGSLHKNNTSCLLLGLYHASVN